MRTLLLALLVAAAPVLAGDRVVVPVLIRLTGHPGPPHAGETGTTNLVLRAGDADHRYQLRSLEVVTGNRSSSDVVSQIDGYVPSLYLRGPRQLLDRFTAATSGDTVVLQGFLRRDGGRNLQVSEVTVTASPAGR